MDFLLNGAARPGDAQRASMAILGPAPAARVQRLLALCPRHAPTPLIARANIAAELGLGGVHIKDESQRMGLQSFKALGGVYAILEELAATGAPLTPEALRDPGVRAAAQGMTFICASDGNHGRSVAAGARMVGARCVVVLHEGVSAARADAIATLGARIVRTRGGYDSSVDAAREMARANGWVLISDTAERDDDPIAQAIMRGYTVIGAEALAQSETAFTHVFVQAGVGGLAAAMAGWLRLKLGAAAPKIVVVEPASAACLLESCRRGALVELPEEAATIYAMLECRRPSAPAWTILRWAADAFIAVDDADAARWIRRLAESAPPIEAGPSGCSGLVGLAAACAQPAWRAVLELNEQARVLLINSEGATDREEHARLLADARLRHD